METVFSTQRLTAPEQFPGFWHAIRTRFQPIELERVGAGRFCSEIRQSVAARVSFTHITCDPVLVRYGSARHDAPPGEQYLIRLQLEGHSALSQFGRSVVLEAGEFTVLDPSEPYTISNKFGTMQCFIAAIGREFINERLGDGRSYCAHRYCGQSGPARVALKLLAALSEEAHALRQSELEHAIRAAMALLVPELVRHGALASQPLQRIDRTNLRMTVEHYIEANLADPTLCPRRIAREHDFSVRYLFKLFEASGATVAELIRKKRLMRSHEDLLNPLLAAQTITHIAYANGFCDAAHFSRSFRQEFGMSPRELREKGVRE